jgi:hypothetical protein
MAAVNGLGSQDFALDMGLTLRKFIELDAVALQDLAELSDLQPEALEALISWTGQGVGSVRMAFRGEVFVSRALRNPKIRGCPVCLRRDAEAHGGAPYEAMAMRGDWQLREVSICIQHRHSLVPLWEMGPPSHRYNISERLEEIRMDILQGRLDQPQVEPSDYDLWLDGRLEDGRDDTWLANHSLYAATTFLRLFGVELLRLDETMQLDASSRIRTAQAKAFNIARHGESAIKSALNDLASLATGAADEPSKAFGELFTNLSRAYVDEPVFEPFRTLLRDQILDVWPFAAGEMLLGQAIQKRKLHSVPQAARDIGVGSVLLEQFLIEVGAISQDDDRPIARKTFDAERHATLLLEIPQLIGPIEMRRGIGATEVEFESLVEARLLIPRTAIPTIKSPWRKSDGIDLVAELQALAQPVDATDTAWEKIQLGHHRKRVDVGTLIAAIRARQIALGQRMGGTGYSSLVVLKTEVNSIALARQIKSDRGLLPAAALGRQVGVRDGSKFLNFLSAGHSPTTSAAHPATGAPFLYVSADDIAAFHAKYVTATTLVAETGEHRNSVRSKLKGAKIPPFAPNGEDFGNIYLREEAKAAFA